MKKILSDYYITDCGTVHSFKRIIPRVMKQQLLMGYPSVEIDGKRYYIHRLLAEAYIDNPQNKPQINHKDGNRTNNNIDNLEWVTNSENQIHKFKVLGRKNNTRKLTDDQVRVIRSSSLSGRKLSKIFGVSEVIIHNIRKWKSYKNVI